MAYGYPQQQSPPGYYQPQQPGYHQPPQAAYGPPPPRARKKRRVFLWIFLAIQALFIVWLVVGLATIHTAPTHAALVSGCYHHNWFPIFKSQADCVTHYGGALNTAGTLGKGIGAVLVVSAWLITDVFLGIGYVVYKLARR